MHSIVPHHVLHGREVLDVPLIPAENLGSRGLLVLGVQRVACLGVHVTVACLQ